MEMVERSGHLDQRLQKGLLRLIQRQPDDLPMFVSEEELTPTVASEPFFERSTIPVKRHVFSICDPVAGDVSSIQ